ncbi:MAG: hypothetical protein JSC189_000400 [Candidatus Tokpelaia sp. JSC189]|nr:MAG: hypothetical protein JSC189_000400 [Candidatus Tokpelaia sp. JSC189]
MYPNNVFMIKISHLLKIIDVYRSSTGLADSSISTYVFNDGKKIRDLRKGAEISVRRFNNAFHWFSDHWPCDVEWPDEVERPVGSVEDGRS